MENGFQSDTRQSDNVIMEITIAGFFHCENIPDQSENIPDQTLETSCFYWMIQVDLLVGKDFTMPQELKVVLFKLFTEKNEINDHSIIRTRGLCQLNEWNKLILFERQKTFGLAWLWGCGMIKQMSLLDMLALCGEEPSVLISIFYCSDHISKGRIKDETYIVQLIKGKVC